jgi:hypothetical protein
MPKSRKVVQGKPPVRILGIRPWVLLVGGLTFAATHAIAKAKIRRSSPAEKADIDRPDPLSADDPTVSTPGVDTGK